MSFSLLSLEKRSKSHKELQNQQGQYVWKRNSLKRKLQRWESKPARGKKQTWFRLFSWMKETLHAFGLVWIHAIRLIAVGEVTVYQQQAINHRIIAKRRWQRSFFLRYPCAPPFADHMVNIFRKIYSHPQALSLAPLVEWALLLPARSLVAVLDLPKPQTGDWSHWLPTPCGFPVP